MSRSPDGARQRALPLVLRLLGVAAALLFVVLLPASPAAAHAVLVASQPANGAVLAAAAHVGKQASVGIRVNPDVAADTHPYTKTGDKTAKFGVPFAHSCTSALRS